jgi:hypothetical protein
MPEYYVIVSQLAQEKSPILKPLCGHLYSKSKAKADAEAKEYAEKLNGGWDFDVLREWYHIVTASAYGTTRGLKGFATFSRRRVTDKSKWDLTRK